MQTQVKQTNTTEAVTVLSHADLVRVLGLAVMVDAGLQRDQPGTTITAELAPAEADGEFTATVTVLIDHNAKAPEAKPEDGAGAGGASLNSDSVGQPGTAPGSAPAAGAASMGGLQIPGAPTA